MPQVDFSFYLVTDRHQTHARPLLDVIHAAVRAGVRAIQLREKDLATRSLAALACDVSALVRASGGRMFVNDRLDVCWASQSSGVQLPASGLPIPVARTLLGPAKFVAVSAHSAAEAAQAEAQGADFVVLGPLFDTPSKRSFGSPIGLKELERARKVCRIPLFGIGGITAERVPDVIRAGAHGVAVIGAVMSAPDVEAAARGFLTALEGLTPTEVDGADC